MNISLNDDLYSQLKEYLEETSFKNIEDLIEFILEDYLGSVSRNTNDMSNEKNNDLLNKRLKDLGYL